MQIEIGGPGAPAFEYVCTKEGHEVEDGKIQVIGPVG